MAVIAIETLTVEEVATEVEIEAMVETGVETEVETGAEVDTEDPDRDLLIEVVEVEVGLRKYLGLNEIEWMAIDYRYCRQAIS